jgi:hypothetical protein
LILLRKINQNGLHSLFCFAAEGGEYLLRQPPIALSNKQSAPAERMARSFETVDFFIGLEPFPVFGTGHNSKEKAQRANHKRNSTLRP